MKQLFFSIMICGLSIPLFANNDGDAFIPEVESAYSIADTISASNKETPKDAPSDEVNALLLSIKSMQKENKLLQSQIEQLKADTIRLAKANGKQLDNIRNIEKEKSELQNKLNERNKQYNEIVEKIRRVDAIIYKQCLLYPLEGRFNSESITESLNTVEAFSKLSNTPSEKFINYRKVYEPLLRDYERYNNEIIIFLETKVKPRINKDTGILGTSHKDRLQRDLKALSYYKFYLSRNTPPYRSIIYLDDTIDMFIETIKKQGNIEKDIEKLIKRLSPKDSVNPN